MRLRDPKNDVIFKALLTRNPLLLADVIERVLDLPAPLSEVTVLNPSLEIDRADDKASVLDVRCRLADGRLIGLEMQVDVRPVFVRRLLYYWARSYGGQLVAGRDYSALRPSISIAWLARNIFAGETMHTIAKLCDVHTHRLICEDVELHFMELSKLRPEDLQRDRAAPWARFFRFESEDDIEQLAKEFPIMSQAKVALGKLSEDERLAQIAEDQHRAWASRLIEKQFAREEGHAEGKAIQLRESILDMCEIGGIAVTETQKASLAAMSLSELEALRARIKSERRWE
jgi:predicted transposase/invertase (TIGR01784 family)